MCVSMPVRVQGLQVHCGVRDAPPASVRCRMHDERRRCANARRRRHWRLLMLLMLLLLLLLLWLLLLLGLRLMVLLPPVDTYY